MTTFDKMLEKDLIIDIQKGNIQSFDALYNRYSLKIYRTLLKMVKEELVAEELLQDVFVKIWDKKLLIDPEMPFGAFLYRVTERLVYDYYRKIGREERFKKEVVNNYNGLDCNTEETIQYKETLGVLYTAIDQLPIQQKQVFTLCKMEGKSYTEVSKIMGISVSTINGHIVKSTKYIKHYLLGLTKY